MTQPTPGPWTTRATNELRTPYLIKGDEGDPVAAVYWDEHMQDPDNEPAANASLIAQAPAMLAEGIIPDVLETLATSIATVAYDSVAFSALHSEELLDIADTLRGHATRQRALLRALRGGEGRDEPL